MNQRSSQSVFDSKRGIVMGFLGPGEDLITGLKKELKKHGITSGSISCIGSLSNLSIVQLDYDDNQMSYSKPIRWDSPVELLSGNGIVGKDEQGELDIHFHGVFVDHKKNISGGHFLQGGNIVAITLEFTVLTSDMIQPKREVDASLGFPLFNFYANER
ncbi:PPC domain-containing DNA-binding protein [Metabacillus iocasae]|uniref:DNA-binding protein with PD1-like motif n=1 Tax=Priestia iocasae TaxID=2291674 RepID=A0ABS2QX42_9BACI|nr:PPC domain-containing DNA-binding protein [Metabacillus iocasae]MBM7703567.1 putative DNA-binding protein with PD1-like motif [Metabacillus iocasae]